MVIFSTTLTIGLDFDSANDSRTSFPGASSVTPFISLSLRVRVQILSLQLTTYIIVAKLFNSELTIFSSVHSSNIPKGISSKCDKVNVSTLQV